MSAKTSKPKTAKGNSGLESSSAPSPASARQEKSNLTCTKPLLRLSVGDLIQFSCREGSLPSLQFQGVSPKDGIRLHQTFYRKLRREHPEWEVLTEYSLQHRQSFEQFDIQLQGRADVLLRPKVTDSDSDSTSGTSSERAELLIELKSFAGSPARLDAGGDELHWAQLYCYAAMYHQPRSDGEGCYPLQLIYLSRELDEPLIYRRSVKERELYDFFQQALARYARLASYEQRYRHQRDESLRQLKFPFSSLRPGQEQLIKVAFQSIADEQPLLAQAPTGIGKTLATLYPAVKSLLWPERGQKIFYLTAKAASRQVAEDCLRLLREKGLYLRSLRLLPKQESCPCPEVYCDADLCPYAQRYYEKLNPLLQEILQKDYLEIGTDLLLKWAQEHQLCPFELALDLAQYADVVIGDYNYFFDPSVRLTRFFTPPTDRKILLVDEAHNLLARSLEMYSARLNLSHFRKAYAVARLYSPRLEERMLQLLRYFSTLLKAVQEEEQLGEVKGFSRLETLPPMEQEQREEQFLVVRAPLLQLRKILNDLLLPLRRLLDQLEEAADKQALLAFYFELRFFLKVQEEYWNEAYVACFRLEQGGRPGPRTEQVFASAQETFSKPEGQKLPTKKKKPPEAYIELRCLDSSRFLQQSYLGQHTPLFFSATLSPIDYYRWAYCAEHPLLFPSTLSLDSPFDPEHHLQLVYTQVDTRQSHRQEGLGELAKLLARVLSMKLGNYLLFFPSYAYLRLLLPRLREEMQRLQQKGAPAFELLEQRPEMSVRQRQNFLAAFDKPASTHSRIGLVVLGGSFGEGIDLKGERLIGVIVVGTGLPALTAERSLMASYYDSQERNGYLYSYVFPAINKVQQAVGRLIRGENDKGFSLLCDQRFSVSPFRDFLPTDWHPLWLDRPKDVLLDLKQFYQSPLFDEKDDRDVSSNG